MENTREYRCYGRNRSWRRCGRSVSGKRFCLDHKWQPFIAIIFVLFTVVPALITIRTYFWLQRSSDSEIENSISFSNPPHNNLKETFDTKPTDKPDYTALWVYDPTSGRMEEIKPEKGRIYTTKSRTGGKLDYMVEDGKIYTDYTSSDGSIKSYYVSDFQGNLLDQKFPYNIAEYKVVIPPELELRRTERLMPNGWTSIHVDLKWGGKVQMVLDPDKKLQWVHIEGGVRTNHKLKTLVAGRTDKTTKWILPNKADTGDGK